MRLLPVLNSLIPNVTEIKKNVQPGVFKIAAMSSESFLQSNVPMSHLTRDGVSLAGTDPHVCVRGCMLWSSCSRLARSIL